MNAEKMREEFEAAYQAEVERSGMTFEPAVFAKNEGVEYVNGLVQSAWWAWQASRAALVVELPSTIDVPKGAIAAAIIHCFNTAVEGLREALEAAGLKVK